MQKWKPFSFLYINYILTDVSVLFPPPSGIYIALGLPTVLLSDCALLSLNPICARVGGPHSDLAAALACHMWSTGISVEASPRAWGSADLETPCRLLGALPPLWAPLREC